ncbi:MAG: hypothetical protein K2M27_02360 [Muribaculaceae bacterium]|nr:hypothetical protein [Muribaculaceae bacterium]MDE6532363.1 hypothetical protein [Muribaculaceae bacterium]
MKKFLFLISCVAGIAGLYVGHGTPESSKDLTTENIERLGLSAAESTCDASNKNECAIYSGGVLVGKATGAMHYQN